MSKESSYEDKWSVEESEDGFPIIVCGEAIITPKHKIHGSEAWQMAQSICDQRNAQQFTATQEDVATIERQQKALLRIFDWAHSNRTYAEVSKIEGNTLLQDICEGGLGYWPALYNSDVRAEIESHRTELAKLESLIDRQDKARAEYAEKMTKELAIDSNSRQRSTQRRSRRTEKALCLLH